MSWITGIQKVAVVGFIISFLCSIYFNFISHKNLKVFFEDFDKFTVDDPDEILSDDETKEIYEKYNQNVVNPMLKDKAFRILYVIFGGIAVLLCNIK